MDSDSDQGTAHPWSENFPLDVYRNQYRGSPLDSVQSVRDFGALYHSPSFQAEGFLGKQAGVGVGGVSEVRGGGRLLANSVLQTQQDWHTYELVRCGSTHVAVQIQTRHLPALRKGNGHKVPPLTGNPVFGTGVTLGASTALQAPGPAVADCSWVSCVCLFV